jgi:hypothetical protein
MMQQKKAYIYSHDFKQTHFGINSKSLIKQVKKLGWSLKPQQREDLPHLIDAIKHRKVQNIVNQVKKKNSNSNDDFVEQMVSFYNCPTVTNKQITNRKLDLSAL